MSLSPADLARLDEAYRRTQAGVMFGVGTAVYRMFRKLTLEDLTAAESAMLEQFLARSTAIIEAGHARTERNADDFYSVVRRGQVGLANVPAVEIETPPPAQIRTSLYVTGVVGVRERIRAIPDTPRVIRPEAPPAEGEGPPLIERQRKLLVDGRQAAIREAIDKAGMAAVGAAIKHTGHGGREKIKAIAKADPKATGYARVTRDKACYWCAMLAGRGAVYKKDSFDASDARYEGFGTAKIHDNCQCSMRPMFTREEHEWPEMNQVWHEMWMNEEMEREIRESSPRIDPIMAWRRLYEGRLQEG